MKEEESYLTDGGWRNKRSAGGTVGFRLVSYIHRLWNRSVLSVFIYYRDVSDNTEGDMAGHNNVDNVFVAVCASLGNGALPETGES